VNRKIRMRVSSRKWKKAKIGECFDELDDEPKPQNFLHHHEGRRSLFNSLSSLTSIGFLPPVFISVEFHNQPKAKPSDRLSTKCS
jgi:hypothetical protein